MKKIKHLSYIEISKQNLEHNYRYFKKLLSPKTKIVSVVKANAYGHGEEEVVKILNRYADYFQVDDFVEFERIKKITKKPILILGYISHNELRKAIKQKAIFAVYDIERLKILELLGAKLKIKPKIHIKIDAFLGRQGVLPNDLNKFIKYCSNLNHIKIVGVYSHFANIEDTNNFSHAQKQIIEYSNSLDKFTNAGFKNILSHISATAGVLRYEQNKGLSDLARIGLGIYGMWPSLYIKKEFQKSIKLKPIIRWITHIAQVKTLPSNYPVGYGLTFITKKPTKVAVIPQGYSDGYDRKLSNKGSVLIHGKKCKILGRIAMNMFAVDVSDLRLVKQEDEVVLLGKQKNSEISVEDLAKQTNTINYEVTTKISPFLPRVVI